MQCAEVIRELAVPTDDRDVAALAKHLRACASCASWAKRTAQLDRLWEATRPTEPSHDTWAGIWANLAALLDSPTPADVETLPISMRSSNGSVARVELPVVPNRVPSRSRPWTFTAIALLGLGQAAAVFLAISLAGRPSATPRSPQIANHSTPVPPFAAAPTVALSDMKLLSLSVEIDEGQQVVIRFDGPAAKVVDLTPEGVSRSVDDWYVMLNVADVSAIPACLLPVCVDDWYVMLNVAESLPNSVVAMKE